MGVGVRTLALILTIAGPMVLAVIVIMNRHSMAKQKFEKMHQALESGRSPEDLERMIEVLEKTKNSRSSTGYFRTGFVVLGLSLASLVVGLIIGVKACLAAAAGGIVFGLALIAVWFLLDRST